MANDISNRIKLNSRLVINDSIRHYKASNSKLAVITRKNNTDDSFNSNWYKESANPVEIYSQIEDVDNYENIDDLVVTTDNQAEKSTRDLIRTNEFENDTSEDNEDIIEDDEVAIEDYSCFQLNSTKKFDDDINANLLNETNRLSKTIDQQNNDKNVTRTNTKVTNLIEDPSTASTASFSTSTASLPPLPRQPTHHSSNSSNNSSIISPTTDFDRSLHCRRSNRYLRQLTPNNLVIQDININASSSSHVTSPSTLNSIKENSTDSVNQNQTSSLLTKANSTPSLVENSENLKVDVQEETLVESKLKQSLSTLSLKVDEAIDVCKLTSPNEVVERKVVGKNGKKYLSLRI